MFSPNTTFRLGITPHVRERRLDLNPVHRIRGITPACAGKTACFLPVCARARDHPRVCGKDWGHCFLTPLVPGSPPRVRERPCIGLHTSRITGITPACAGKTIQAYISRKSFWDHPRVCGKDGMTLKQGYMQEGSPPRVRERLHHHFLIFSFLRITPACAGKTTSRHRHFLKLKDHPRVCGKDTRLLLVKWLSVGSPPRVRERQDWKSALASNKGITPACAGKTLKDPFS